MRSLVLIPGFIAVAGVLQAQGTTSVAGRVQDQNGGPIREALVVIDPDSLRLRARTGEDGRFSIPRVPAGRYEVRVVRIGYRPHSRMIDVGASPLEIQVDLQGVPIPLDTVAVRATRPGLYGLVVTRGIALMPHDPRSLRGADIEVLGQSQTVKTGPDGRFSLPQFPRGAHEIMVTLDGFAARMIPVTMPDDGGVEITVTLDSLYADYQRWDEEQMRGVSWRMRRKSNPATIVPLHDIDMEAKDLREAIRYSHALLSRGLVIHGGCIYVNGKPYTEIALPDIDPKDVVALEVYPPNTIPERDRLAEFPIGTPCENLWGPRLPERGRIGTANRRVPVRSRGNQDTTILIWTRGRG
jgi:hypothetical protein